jgi:hypothetical protein
MASCSMMVPASSRSEFVMVPVGFDQLTSFVAMPGGKRARHRIGASVLAPEPGLVNSGDGGNATPPMPLPEASAVPWIVGVVATSSARRVGRFAMFAANHRKSSRVSWTPRLRRKRLRVRDGMENLVEARLAVCR